MSRFRSRRAVWLGTVMLGVTVTAAVGGWSLTRPGPEQRTITVGTTDEVASLDPAGAYDAGSWRLFGNVYQSLLTFTSGTAEPVPDAAEQCRFTDGGLRRYRCTLREGLTFSDGSPLTADDVKHTFDRILRIGHPRGPAPLFGTLREVRVDGQAVEFRLKTPDATFPYKIASAAGSLVDSELYPAGELLKGSRAVGSGPYALQGYEPGREARLVPNERYTGLLEERPTHPVRVRYYTEPAALSAAWRNREVEVSAGELPPAETAGISPSDEGIRIHEHPGLDIRSLVFNLRPSSPTARPAVRQAVASLVNRTAIARHVHRRTVEPLYSLIPRGVNGHGTPFHDRYGDPDAGRARELLRRAGVETPVRFEIAYSRGTAAAEEAEALRGQLEASGLFEVTTRHHEWEDFRTGLAEGSFDACLMSWFPDFPDPATYTDPLVGTDGAYHTGYGDPAVEELIRATRRGYDRTAEIQRFQEIQRRVAADVPVLPLWQGKEYAVSTDDIAGVQYLSDNSGVWRLWELSRI